MDDTRSGEVAEAKERAVADSTGASLSASVTSVAKGSSNSMAISVTGHGTEFFGKQLM
jgi:hypothetical protein